MMPEDYDQIEHCRFAERCAFATSTCFSEHQELITDPDGRRIRCGRWSRGELVSVDGGLVERDDKKSAKAVAQGAKPCELALKKQQNEESTDDGGDSNVR